MRRVEIGVVALVLNNTLLGGVTHGGLRRELLEMFPRLYVMDLGGSAGRQAQGVRDTAATPLDENLFDIRQGVCVLLMAKAPGGILSPKIAHAELRGRRSEKLARLAASDLHRTRWRQLTPVAEEHLLIPHAEACPEFLQAPRLTDIFRNYASGVQTKRDSLFIAHRSDELRARMQRWFEAATSDVASVEPTWLQQRLRALAARGEPLEFDAARICAIATAPWDRRFVYFDPRLLGRARFDVMRQMTHENIGLVFMRQSVQQSPYDHFLVVSSPITDRAFYSMHGTPYLAPLWSYDDSGTGRTSNLRAPYLEELAERASSENHPPAVKQLAASAAFSVDALAYIYGVCCDPGYRARNAAALRRDFPRIPWPATAREFVQRVQLGKQLLGRHLGWEMPSDCRLNWRWKPDGVVGRPSWDEERQAVVLGDAGEASPITQAQWEAQLRRVSRAATVVETASGNSPDRASNTTSSVWRGPSSNYLRRA